MLPATAPFETLRQKLKLRHLAIKEDFAKNYPHAQKFLADRGLELENVRQHSAKLLTAGTLGGALLLSPGAEPGIQALPRPVVHALNPTYDLPYPPQEWLAESLRQILPPIKDPHTMPFLKPDEEKAIGKIIEKSTGIPAVPVLEGEKLNTVYGYIGAEQHLRRWSGDTIGQHGELAHVEGMAPGNGGFGYFANGPRDLEGIEREKYYVVVQLMYFPDWGKRTRYLADWYKWQKVVVVNPDNGKAVVGVIGDAGPAAWTGKHFGGSPEVMDILGGKRYKKGRVLMYFIDDPGNKVPLGQVQYKPGSLEYKPVFNPAEELKNPPAGRAGLTIKQ